MARSTGKYDAVLPGLKPLPPSDLSYQEKVERVKADVGLRQADELAEAYIALRHEKKAVEKQLYDVNLRIEAHEQLLAESQERGGAGWGEYGVKENALRLSSGDTVRIQREPYGQVRDKEAFRLWCIANGYERQLQLWPTTMNAVCKERLMVGEPEPDGCETFAKTKVVYTPRGAE